MPVAKRAKQELTLKDRLSRLTYRQACKLLGPEGAHWIRQGGKFDVPIDGAVYLGGDLFRMNVDGAVATLTLKADKPRRLLYNCDQCQQVCEHVGAAFSLILEEKTALGLAAPPPERVPVESLSEEALIERAVAERKERAGTERMTVKSVDPKRLWTDYLVTNVFSGKTYRVALRGWEPGESYCTCPDFRKNTLGVCKHIFQVQTKARRRFPESKRRRGFVQKEFALHLRYGKDLQLFLLTPQRMEKPIERLIRPIRDRDITDLTALLRCIQRLEALGHDVTIYPDAQEYIDQRLFAARMEKRIADIRKNPARHALRKELLKAELLPYQLDGIAFAVGAGRAVLADDMGLGKTIQGIGVAELLAREAGIGKVLVICPTSLKSQWRSEIKRFSDRTVQLILGTAQQRAEQYDNDGFFTVCNYEQVLRDILSVERVAWDLIVLDEGQRIKNWEAKTSQTIKSLRSRFALVLTGTPLENRLDDLFSVVEFVDDRRLGPAFRFFNHHRVVDEKGKVLGYKNLDALRRTLKPILLRRTREAVMKQLPPRTTEIMRITPTEEQLDLHGAHARIINTIVKKAYISEMDLLRLQKALLMCRMAANSTFLVDKQAPGYSSKLERLDELLMELSEQSTGKTVLFSEWTTMLNLIEPLLGKHKLGFVRLDGSVPQKKRQQLIHTFQTDPDCQLFITTNAGSTGLNLQCANTVINVDLPWNPAILEQRISRAHRMGQRQSVHVYVLVTQETLEENLLATLSAKHELALAALDSESDVDIVELSTGIEELKRRLEVLLGARPAAPIDESQKARQTVEAQAMAQRERVAAAGGQLIGAAFNLLGELAGNTPDTDQSRKLTELVQAKLAECTEQDEQGRIKLAVTLPDRSALEPLARSLARLLGSV